MPRSQKPPKEYVAPSYLVASYVLHRPTSCESFSKYEKQQKYKRRSCYHAAIRIGPTWGGEIIWASDTCCEDRRAEAQLAAQFELSRVRSQRTWPMYWRRPPAGDRNFLFEEAGKDKIQKVKVDKAVKEAARKFAREYREKQRPNSEGYEIEKAIHAAIGYDPEAVAAQRAKEDAARDAREKSLHPDRKPLDNLTGDEYLDSMFGGNQATDKPKGD